MQFFVHLRTVGLLLSGICLYSSVSLAVCLPSLVSFYFLVWPLSVSCRWGGLLFHLITLNKTHTHTHTHGGTPLDKGSARRRDESTHKYSQETNILIPGGFRTHNPSKRAAINIHTLDTWPPGFSPLLCVLYPHSSHNFDLLTPPTQLKANNY